MLHASATAASRGTAVHWALVAGAGAVALAASSLALWLTSGHAAADEPRTLSPPEFAEATGIHVLRVAVVGGGGIVDVRYQVHGGADHDVAPIALLDEETGLLLADGVHGRHSASSTRPEAVRYVLLSNTAGALEPGETVSLIVGGVRLEHVPVQ